MKLTKNADYENASTVLIRHTDDVYSNNTLVISCVKSRKINNDGSSSSWGDLKFRFEITNPDMKYNSRGQYRNIILNRSEFLSWMLSLQDASHDPNLYASKINVKRRINNKKDLIVRFAVSEKTNMNAVLLCIVDGQSSLSKIGIDGLLFGQFLLQLGKMAVDILKFELEFDSMILSYKSTQHIEYQSQIVDMQVKQNEKIIELLTNINTLQSTVKVDSKDEYVEDDDSFLDDMGFGDMSVNDNQDIIDDHNDNQENDDMDTTLVNKVDNLNNILDSLINTTENLSKDNNSLEPDVKVKLDNDSMQKNDGISYELELDNDLMQETETESELENLEVSNDNNSLEPIVKVKLETVPTEKTKLKLDNVKSDMDPMQQTVSNISSNNSHFDMDSMQTIEESHVSNNINSLEPTVKVELEQVSESHSDTDSMQISETKESHFDTDSMQISETKESQVSNNINSLEPIVKVELEQSKIANSNNLSDNISNFSNNLTERIANTDLVKLSKKRLDGIENPPVKNNKVEIKTKLMDYCEKHSCGIDFISNTFIAVKKTDCLYHDASTYYYDKVFDKVFQHSPSNPEDLFSLRYMTQLQYNNLFENYNNEKTRSKFVDIPLFYETKNETWSYEETRNIFDLLAIYVFATKASKVIKLREEDSFKNKEIFVKCFRLMFEPIYLTYLMSDDVIFDQNLENVILKHYKDLNLIGFFDTWKTIFSDLEINAPKIQDIINSISDFKKYVDNMKQHVKEKTDSKNITYTQYVHETFCERRQYLKIPYKNGFEIEHINELIYIEIILDGYLFQSEEEFFKYINDSNLEIKKESNDVLTKLFNCFSSNTSEKKQEIILDKIIDGVPNDKKTSLWKYVSKHLPADFVGKDILLDNIKEVYENDYDISKLPEDIDIHTIPDDILIALDVWKPSGDFRLKQIAHLTNSIHNYWRTSIDIITEYSNKINSNVKENDDELADDQWDQFI